MKRLVGCLMTSVLGWTAFGLAAMGGGQAQARCTNITTKLHESMQEPLGQLVKDFALKAPRLSEKFHPKLQLHKAVLHGELARIENTLTPPLEWSLFQVWHIKSRDINPIPCRIWPTDHLIHVYTHIGYDEQYAAWIQIQGKKELGRMFITLVSAPTATGSFFFSRLGHSDSSDWLISALMWQPRTWGGGDAKTWLHTSYEAITPLRLTPYYASMARRLISDGKLFIETVDIPGGSF